MRESSALDGYGLPKFKVRVIPGSIALYCRVVCSLSCIAAQIIDWLHMTRKIAEHICLGFYDAVIGDSDSINSECSLDATERDAAITAWLGKKFQRPTDTTRDETANHGDVEEELNPDSKTLLDSEAYRWLVSMMRRGSRLNGIDPHCMISHRAVMTLQLQSVAEREAQKAKSLGRTTFNRQPPLYVARFELPWDPMTFLWEDYKGDNPGEAVSQFVTLTGDGRSVQAETCRGYFEQVWPTTGSQFIDLVEELVTRAGQRCKRKFPVSYIKRFKSDCLFQRFTFEQNSNYSSTIQQDLRHRSIRYTVRA